MTTRFIATGTVLGYSWFNNEAITSTKIFNAETLEQLKAEITKELNEGTITGTDDLQKNLIGCVMDIQTIRTIEFEGRVYTNTEIESVVFGDLTEEQCEGMYEVGFDYK